MIGLDAPTLWRVARGASYCYRGANRGLLGQYWSLWKRGIVDHSSKYPFGGDSRLSLRSGEFYIQILQLQASGRWRLTSEAQITAS